MLFVAMIRKSSFQRHAVHSIIENRNQDPKKSKNSGGKKTEHKTMPLRECKMCGWILIIYCSKDCARNYSGGKVNHRG